MSIFLLDLATQKLVEIKYGLHHEDNVEGIITCPQTGRSIQTNSQNASSESLELADSHSSESKRADDPAAIERLRESTEVAFHQHIGAFLILEFGIILHSVLMGMCSSTARSHL